jgi:ABC-2 type transport system permease protein
MTPLTWHGRLRKYFMIFRVSLTERLTYRADFFLATVLRFLPMLTSILLWTAIFESSPEKNLNGFDKNRMIAYLLLVHISRMFSSMPGLAGGIARDIRDGTLKRYLLQPIDMIAYLVSYRAAHKAAYIATSALPYALLFWLCHQYFTTFPDPLTFAAYVVSLLLAFVVGFFFEACVGMIGFWFLEVTSLLYIVNTLNFFISGQMFPLDLLGEPWVTLFKALPFQFLAYFPAAVFLGQVSGGDLAWGLGVQAAWAVALIVLSRWLFRVGLRRYSAFGG